MPESSIACSIDRFKSTATGSLGSSVFKRFSIAVMAPWYRPMALSNSGRTLENSAARASFDSSRRPLANSPLALIEINRAIYLDEAALCPGAGFERLRRDLDRLFKALTQNWPKAL